MPSRPEPQPGILKIDPYVPGRSTAAPGVKATKLSANESPLGASPLAIAALREADAHPEIYPEGSSRHLREALGEVHGLDPEQIVCGNGSDDLLHLLAQSYLGGGDDAVMSQYCFSIYPIVTLAAGATPVLAAENDYRADVDALLEAVTARTKVLFLANPNNPTGTYIGAEELHRLHKGLRPDILLVIDGAYAEYVTASDYDVGIKLVDASENIVMVRTFSKIGLAANRIGWLYGPAHLVDVLNRIRGPFNVNRPAQFAAAAAARDKDFTKRLSAHNAEWRTWLTSNLASNSMRVIPSQGNFILVLFETATDADRAFNRLLSEGLIVRQLGTSYSIANGLRISIGSETSMRRVAECLANFGGSDV